MLALVVILILAWLLPGSIFLWLGVFFVALIIFLVVTANDAEAEESGRKPTIREVDGKEQDIKVYIEERIESMYAAGKTDVDVAHAFDFFRYDMWLYYHPFLCWDSTWWRVYDTQRPHKQADAFQERMRRKYPQAYSHYPADPSNTSEIEAEYTRFMFDYCRSRGTCAGGIPSCSHREPSAQEKSIAWTLVTGDPVLGHALGHSDDDRKSD